MSTLIGMYNDLATAEQVEQDLLNHGFSRNDIHVASHEGERKEGFFQRLFGGSSRSSGTDAQFSNDFKDWGVPAEDAGYFAEGLRRGSAMVMVDAPDNQADAARDIMDGYGPIDVQERARQWQSEGWQGYQANAQPFTRDEMNRERTRYTSDINQGGETTLPVTEEELRVGKRQVQRGGVRLYTRVVEQPVQQDVNLRDETVHVDRRKVDRPASQADMDAFKEGTLDVTETDEEAVVDKQAHVVEEVSVRKDVQERPETVRDTVRRTQVETEDLGQSEKTSDFNTYAPEFRSHYQTTYSNSGYDYSQFEPAYRYGYDTANSGRYRGRNWNDIQGDLRSRWENDYPDQPWDQYQEAVRQGWQQAANS